MAKLILVSVYFLKNYFIIFVTVTFSEQARMHWQARLAQVADSVFILDANLRETVYL